MESQTRPNTVEYLLTPLRSASNADQFMAAAEEVEEGTEEAEGDGCAPQEHRWTDLEQLKEWQGGFRK